MGHAEKWEARGDGAFLILAAAAGGGDFAEFAIFGHRPAGKAQTLNAELLDDFIIIERIFFIFMRDDFDQFRLDCIPANRFASGIFHPPGKKLPERKDAPRRLNIFVSHGPAYGRYMNAKLIRNARHGKRL